MRYERKYLIDNYSHLDVEQIIKFHPACFSEIYYQRIVNNIYFDTPGFQHYYDNIEGSTNRLKVRIRWYGNIFGVIEKPVLEFKIKKGLLGTKQSFILNGFTLSNNFSMHEVEQMLNTSNVNLKMRNELKALAPTLLNSYTRRYFESKDKLFRITIDNTLSYFKIGNTSNISSTKKTNHHSTILELKYDSQNEDSAKEIGNNLPFMLTKNSKYLQGLQSILL